MAKLVVVVQELIEYGQSVGIPECYPVRIPIGETVNWDWSPQRTCRLKALISQGCDNIFLQLIAGLDSVFTPGRVDLRLFELYPAPLQACAMSVGNRLRFELSSLSTRTLDLVIVKEVIRPIQPHLFPTDRLVGYPYE